MRVLFVYRGYGVNKSNSVIDFQRISLHKGGIEILVFPIIQGGVVGYLKSFWKLKSFLRTNSVDLIHAHYSFSGFIASLSSKSPVICSLMGSDVLQGGFILRWITGYFYKKKWKITIVKSKEMQKIFPNAKVIKNGVDLTYFFPSSKTEATKKLGFNPLDKNIIFVAQDSTSHIKNLQLAQKSIELINNNNIKLHIVSNKSFKELPQYYNAADLLLLTSISEGSPNVIKEAMACNCPIVATDVGDIRELIDNTEGCFITDFNHENIAQQLKLALELKKRTNGRDKIQDLDSRIVAQKIIEIYRDVLKM